MGILVFSNANDLKAQAYYDSLLTVWEDPSYSDSLRVRAYVETVWSKYTSSRPDSAIILSRALFDFDEEHNYPMATAYGLHMQGVASYYIGDDLGALNYYIKTLKAYEEIGYTFGVAAILNNIGSIHDTRGNLDKALEYYQQAYELHQETQASEILALVLGNIGLIHSKKKDYDLAIELNFKALELLEKSDIYNGTSLTYKNLGSIYSDKGEPENAIKYYQMALESSEKLNDLSAVALSSTSIGELYFQIDEIEKAQDYCTKGLNTALEIGVLNVQKLASQCLYDVSKKLGNSNDALTYLEQIQTIDKELNQIETTKKLEQMEFAKVLQKDSIKNAEKALLVEASHQEEVKQKNKTRNVFIGSTLLFLALAGGSYSRWRFVRKAKKQVEFEKARSENLLLNILPADIAEELKEKGKVDARDFEMISILFSDFKGFTEQSEKLAPSELVAEINHCFEGFDDIMEKHGVEKIKTTGDSYMAAGGLPIQSDDSVKNTVLAALDMQEFITKRKTENEAIGKPAFDMRVGIHTGPVVAGIVGVKKFQYDIWGDTVNTASRMESNGEIGMVNISKSTYDLLKDDPQFSFQSRGKIEVKGKGMTEMYFVTKK